MIALISRRVSLYRSYSDDEIRNPQDKGYRNLYSFGNDLAYGIHLTDPRPVKNSTFILYVLVWFEYIHYGFHASVKNVIMEKLHFEKAKTGNVLSVFC